MISTAIQSTVQAIIPNTFDVYGDEQISLPICLHREKGTPILLKAGLAGYSYAVEIEIIDKTADAVEVLVQSVKTALEALAGTTVSSTVFETVNLEDENPDFDTENRLYSNILQFTINTANR
jgi:hypothetical protein